MLGQLQRGILGIELVQANVLGHIDARDDSTLVAVELLRVGSARAVLWHH